MPHGPRVAAQAPACDLLRSGATCAALPSQRRAQRTFQRTETAFTGGLGAEGTESK